MAARRSGGVPPDWLAPMARSLLEEKYGPGRIPGVRQISAHIALANDGETISHGHIHNILSGDAQNLTDHTRNLLARFFGRHPSYFHPPQRAPQPDPDAIQKLAARLATFDPAQVEAIRMAIDILAGPLDNGRK